MLETPTDQHRTEFLAYYSGSCRPPGVDPSRLFWLNKRARTPLRSPRRWMSNAMQRLVADTRLCACTATKTLKRRRYAHSLKLRSKLDRSEQWAATKRSQQTASVGGSSQCSCMSASSAPAMDCAAIRELFPLAEALCFSGTTGHGRARKWMQLVGGSHFFQICSFSLSGSPRKRACGRSCLLVKGAATGMLETCTRTRIRTRTHSATRTTQHAGVAQRVLTRPASSPRRVSESVRRSKPGHLASLPSPTELSLSLGSTDG